MLNGQTLAPSSMVTSPMTWAAMSTKAPGCTFGVRPGTERIMRALDHPLGAKRADLGGRVAGAGQHGVGVGAEQGRGHPESRGRAGELHRIAQHLHAARLRVN